MSLAFIVMLIIFVLIFILNIPFPLGLLSACIAYYWISGLKLSLVASTMMNYYYISYVMVAVPLFLLTANLMNSSKITDYIFDFSGALVGKRKGALGYVNVIASLIFAGMTGSYLSDAAGLGAIEMRAMKEKGYDDAFACSITAASAVLGPIFPPSIVFLMYAVITDVSIGKLFIAGIIPAIVLTISMLAYCYFAAKKRNYPEGEKLTAKEFFSMTARALPAILTPVVLLLGMYTGIFTPTEAASIACFYALIVSALVYRTMGLKKFIGCMRDTVQSAGSVCIMVGASAVLSNIFLREGISEVVTEFIIAITHGNSALFMLAVIILLLILGCFIDASATLVIVVPLLTPVAAQLGIDLVQFGVVITVALMLGFCTPPFGLGLFVVANIQKAPIGSIIKEIWKPVLAMIAALFALAYIPGITLWLPSLLG